MIRFSSGSRLYRYQGMNPAEKTDETARPAPLTQVAARCRRDRPRRRRRHRPLRSDPVARLGARDDPTRAAGWDADRGAAGHPARFSADRTGTGGSPDADAADADAADADAARADAADAAAIPTSTTHAGAAGNRPGSHGAGAPVHGDRSAARTVRRKPARRDAQPHPGRTGHHDARSGRVAPAGHRRSRLRRPRLVDVAAERDPGGIRRAGGWFRRPDPAAAGGPDGTGHQGPARRPGRLLLPGPAVPDVHNAAVRAIQLGFRNVLWYRGGLEAWQSAGQPVRSGDLAHRQPDVR